MSFGGGINPAAIRGQLPQRWTDQSPLTAPVIGPAPVSPAHAAPVAPLSSADLTQQALTGGGATIEDILSRVNQENQQQAATGQRVNQALTGNTMTIDQIIAAQNRMHGRRLV